MHNAVIPEEPEGNYNLKQEEEFGLISNKQGFGQQVSINRGLWNELDKDILLILFLLAKIITGEEKTLFVFQQF